MSRMYSSIQILLCHHAIDFSNTFSVKTTDELGRNLIMTTVHVPFCIKPVNT